jgi:hypothetical protein
VDPENPQEVECCLERLATDRGELKQWKARSLGRIQSADWGNTANVLCRAVGAPPN